MQVRVTWNRQTVLPTTLQVTGHQLPEATFKHLTLQTFSKSLRLPHAELRTPEIG